MKTVHGLMLLVILALLGSLFVVERFAMQATMVKPEFRPTGRPVPTTMTKPVAAPVMKPVFKPTGRPIPGGW